jgi:integrase
MQRRAAGTRAACGYAAKHIIEAPIGAVIPRDVDVASVRRFLIDCAKSYGTGGTKHARAVLTRALDIAVETPDLRTPLNAASAARSAIPKNTVRDTGLDHTKAPTDAQVAALLSGLTRDPEARGWYPVTARRRGSLKATHLAAGAGNPRDVADLATVLFATGGRLGEIAALRWCDFDQTPGTVMISSTLTALA